jgi:flagellar basal body-associated protein FliL
MVGKSSKRSIAAVARQRIVYGVTIVIIATAAGAYTYSFFEGDGPDRFRDLADAFWWSAATITSLGPGNELETAGGRIVALALAIVGLVVVAALTGTISAFFVESSSKGDSPTPTTEAHKEPSPQDDGS